MAGDGEASRGGERWKRCSGEMAVCTLSTGGVLVTGVASVRGARGTTHVHVTGRPAAAGGATINVNSTARVRKGTVAACRGEM